MRDELVSNDWDIVKRLLPTDWEISARQCGALRRSRTMSTVNGWIWLKRQ